MANNNQRTQQLILMKKTLSTYETNPKTIQS